MRMLLLVLCLAPAVAWSSPPGNGGITLSDVSSKRSARLISDAQLESSLQPFQSPPLRLSAGAELGYQPLPALDTGGATSAETRQILALVLGLIVGFGTGHLVARDRNGFILFLVVDLAIVVASWVLARFVGFPFLWLGLLASHIIQGLDAYAQAGGERIIQRTREQAVRLALGSGREDSVITSRVFSLCF